MGIRGLALAVVAFFAAPGIAAEEGTRIGEYTFSLDGKPFQPRIIYLHGEPGKPEPGDLFRVERYLLPLGSEKDVHLRFEKASGVYRGLRMVQGGREEWIGVSGDTLLRLQAQELRDIRSVVIDFEDEKALGALIKMDVEHLGVTISWQKSRHPPVPLPTLPRGIRSLSLELDSDQSLKNPEELAKFGDLEFLDIGFADQESVPALLKRLDPLSHLRVLSAHLEEKTRNSFQARHPACQVIDLREGELRWSLQGATRLRLRTFIGNEPDSDGIPHWKWEAPLLVDDPKVIEELIHSISIEGGRSVDDLSWRYIGMIAIDVLQGGQESGGFRYNQGILLPGDWPVLAFPTKESQETIAKWLFARGLKEPWKDLRRGRAHEQADRRQTLASEAGLSSELRAAFEKSDEAFQLALKNEFSDSSDRIRFLLRILGDSISDGRERSWQDKRVEKLLREYSPQELGAICEPALSAPDRLAARGAARWLEHFDLLDSWKLTDPKGAHAAIIALDQDSFIPEERSRMLDHLAKWGAELPRAELDRLLQKHLRDPHWIVRRRAMIAAGILRHQPSEELLLKVLRGEEVQRLPLPGTTDPDLDDDDEPYHDGAIDGAPCVDSGRDIAALALGYLECVAARPLLEARAADSRFFRVALALFGDRYSLRASDFECDHPSLVLAAVEAVVRQKGCVGLPEMFLNPNPLPKLDVNGTAQAVASLRTMLLENRAPGEEKLRQVKDADDLRQWFQDFGQDYLEQLERDPKSQFKPVPKPEINSWITSEDLQNALKEVRQIRFGWIEESDDTTIRIDENITYQEILGLGSSLEPSTCFNFSLLPPALQEETMQRLVDRERGIGMNLMRISIGTPDFTGDPWYSYDDVAPGETEVRDEGLAHFSIEKDRRYILPVLQLARRKNPEILFVASPWSPPGWMKSNGSLVGGRLLPRFYPAYAEYFVRFIEAYGREGIPIHAVTVQNEPGVDRSLEKDPAWHYPSCRWSADEERDFIRDHLGPAFRKRGLKTEIWCYDHNYGLAPAEGEAGIDHPLSILADPGAAALVDGVAFHGYRGEPEAMTIFHHLAPTKAIHFSEGSVFGIGGAVDLVRRLRNWATSYNAWVTILDEAGRPNRGPFPATHAILSLRGASKSMADRRIEELFEYSLYGHFTKFIQRGARRLGSSEWSGPLASVAFRNPDGALVLVVVNPGDREEHFHVEWRRLAFPDAIGPKSMATYRWEGK